MKKLKGFLFTLLMTLSVLTCTACSDTNKDTYKKYVQSVLDTNFKGKYEDYLELTGVSSDSAAKIYEANIQAITDDFIQSGLITDPGEAELSRLREFAIALLGKADYSVQKVETKDGAYYVNVEIRPFVFYETLQNELFTKYSELSEKYQNTDIDSMSNEDYKAYVTEYNEATFVLMEEVLNRNQYEEPVTIACHLIVNKDYYEIESEDYKTIYGTMYVPIEQ